MSDDSRTFELTRSFTSTSLGSGESDRYRIAGELGRGGLGEVFDVEDVLLSRHVALKATLSSDRRAQLQFWHEAQVTAQLDHPNIVAVHDAGRLSDERPFFTMKKIEGEELFEAVANGRLPTLRQRIDVVRAVCDALSYAHDIGYMHRDIKPQNIMVGEYGEVLVVDWGLAWPLDGTRPGLSGTPRYSAPEQMQAQAHDHRADLYALGTTLWYVLTGEEPVGAVVARPDPPRPEVRWFQPPPGRLPRELTAVIGKACARDPEDRYPSARALHDDLLAWLDDRPVSAMPPSAARRAWKWSLRNRGPLLLTTGGVAAVLTILFVISVVTGGLVWRSGRGEARARVAAEIAARDAALAREDAEERLVDAYVAAASAHVAAGRPAFARAAVEDAQELADGLPRDAWPALGLAWSDLERTGTLPLFEHTLDGRPVSVWSSGPDVRVLLEDGRWEERASDNGRVARRGVVPGTGVLVTERGGFLSVDGEDLVYSGPEGEEKARVAAPFEGAVLDAWRLADGVLLQPRDANPLRLSLPSLERVALPFPDGSKVLALDEEVGRALIVSARPDRTLPAEVRSLDGTGTARRLGTGQVQLAAGGVWLKGESGVIRKMGPGETRVGSTGALVQAASATGRVFLGRESGLGTVHDAASGAELATLIGFPRRLQDVDLAPSGGMGVAVSEDGHLAAWAIRPQRDARGVVHAAVHPGGELVALQRDDRASLVHLGSLREVAVVTREGGQLSWSPDGTRLAVGCTVLNLLHGTSTALAPRNSSCRTVWNDAQLVLSRRRVIERFDPVRLDQRDRTEVEGGVWAGISTDDGVVWLSKSASDGDSVGWRVPVDGPVEELDGGGSRDHVGFGVGRIGDRIAFARQNGLVELRRGDSGAADASWSWQSAPLLDLVGLDHGAAVFLTFEGSLQAVDARGELSYALSLGRGFWYGMESVETWNGPELLVWGDRRVERVPLDGRIGSDWRSRARASGAWDLLEPPDPREEPELALTWAFATGAPIEPALVGRDDATAQIIRALAE